MEKREVRKVVDYFRDRRGQVSIFIIVAIVIVAAIIIFVVVREGITLSDIPPEFIPVYDFYGSCIEQETRNALSILGSQGGKIDSGPYIAGSDFAPFSSHLNFLGISVPYWYYVSANGVITEQVPSKTDMENEVSKYLEESINDCDFGSFYDQGFFIELDEDIEVDTEIEDNVVSINVDSNLVVSRNGEGARKSDYNLEVNSKVGSFYDTAVEVYKKQNDILFLEEYAIDVLRLYAPVDGVEVQCSPLIWNTQELVGELQAGLETNMPSIKFEGDYYRIDDEDDKYFVINQRVENPVRILYSRDWPNKVEISPAEQDLVIVEPVGNQQGLGVLGFCYVPYHFVYDLSFPVMVQMSDGFEVFQFPIVVIVDNNLPRAADLTIITESQEIDVCQFAEGDAVIRTFDVNLNSVEAEVSYKCFDSTCNLGKTEISGNDAVLNTKIPLCVNGQILAKADGFDDAVYRFSSNSESFADVILEKEYEIEVEVNVGGRQLGADELALVTFVNEETRESGTVALPETNIIKLKEGSYDVSSYVYGASGVVIPGSIRVECVDVARGGFFGFLGGTTEECFNIEIPATNIDQALVGGGTEKVFVLESDLVRERVIVDVGALPVVNSLEQLQLNYEGFENYDIGVSFI